MLCPVLEIFTFYHDFYFLYFYYSTLHLLVSFHDNRMTSYDNGYESADATHNNVRLGIRFE
jgi:hypothetical protein